MRWSSPISVQLILSLAWFPGEACAQTQRQQDRLDALARYTVTLPMCEKLGFSVVPNPGEKIDMEAKAETDKWNLSNNLIDKLTKESIDRQSKSYTADLDAAVDNAKPKKNFGWSGLFL